MGLLKMMAIFLELELSYILTNINAFKLNGIVAGGLTLKVRFWLYGCCCGQPSFMSFSFFKFWVIPTL